MADRLELIVYAGPYTRVMTPVNALLQLPPSLENGSLTLREARGGGVPCQATRRPGGWEVSWMLDSLTAGESRVYELGAEGVSTEPVRGVPVTRVGQGYLEVLMAGAVFAGYRYAADIRRPFIYPLMGPFGVSVTWDSPPDHPHHDSLWVSHGDLGGVNFWSDEETSGRIVHRRFEALEEGAVYARVVSVNDWVAPGGARMLEETRVMRFYNTPLEGRILDLEIGLMAVRDVVIKDTKEAGPLGARVAESMEVESGGRIVNSEGGVNESETWGRRARWCDYSGPCRRGSDRWNGLAVLDHPANPNHPTYWHVRDYGLICPNISTRFPNFPGGRALKSGDSLRLRYRLYVHKGDAQEAGVEQKHRDYAAPPRVEVNRG